MSTNTDQSSQPPAMPPGWPTRTVAFLFTDVERSLLRGIVTADAHVRFAALEVGGTFFLEQAAESDQIAAMTRHARFFTKQAGVLERGPRSLGIQALRGPRAQGRDTVRQALKWLAVTGDAGKAE